MFKGRIQTIDRDQLPGAAVYNALANAIKHSRSLTPYLHINVSPAGGMQFDVNVPLLQQELEQYRLRPFAATWSETRDDELAVAGGDVWLCDRRLAVGGIKKLKITGTLSIWVEFTKTGGVLRTGKDFPLALDVAGGVCNWPIASIAKNTDKTWQIWQRHEGDIVLMTMPHIFLPGFDEEEYLVRICRNGQERYIVPIECEEEE